jgi:urease accessory protein
MWNTRHRPLPAALALGVVLAAWGLPAEAHQLGAAQAGIAAGFAHPFAGLDHILAMAAVGLWAVQIGRPALWLLPAAFALAMAAGALMAMGGIAPPGIETGIAASVALLGLLVALACRPRVKVAAGLVMLFALFHGQAHGGELPPGADVLAYGFGFVLATALLHAIGLGIGLLLRLPRGKPAVRAAGGAMAVAGVVLLLGL